MTLMLLTLTNERIYGDSSNPLNLYSKKF